MLIHTKGNIIDLAEQGLFDVIVHGCNCQNTMGSGIAKEIRERYPQAYESDTQISKSKNANQKLGTYSEANVGKFVIINAYTQLNYLPRGQDHFDYEGFDKILNILLNQYGNASIGFPYIGMGLAGGDSNKIIESLESFAKKVSKVGGKVTLVEFDKGTR